MIYIFTQKKYYLFALLLAPASSFAAVCPTGISSPLGSGSNFTTFICYFVGIASKLIPLLATLAFLFFVWGLTRFILSAGDEKKTAEGKRIMMWGLIALFVLFSVFGLVQVLSNVFFDGKQIGIPLLPTSTR